LHVVVLKLRQKILVKSIGVGELILLGDTVVEGKAI
jgi:hypothetical protein